MFCAFGAIDGGFLIAQGFRHQGAADAFGGHLAVHGILHVARRDDLADFHVGHFNAPALGHFVEAGAEQGVDVLALGKHVVQRDAADDRAQGGGGHAGRGLFKVADRDHAGGWVENFEVPQEVN